MEIRLLGLLGLLFIGLKLTKQIDWSWWWVLAPFWGPFAAFAAAFVGIVIFYLIYDFIYPK